MATPFFCHYMVGGMREEEAVIDVTRAQAMGFDAFALNILSVEEWAIWSIDFLFKAAVSVGFYLFFSLDMLHFSDPSEFIPLIEKYTQNSAYYHYNGLPFVSTFNGGLKSFGENSPDSGWQIHYKEALASLGISTYFVPDFSDANANADLSLMYEIYSVTDGLFNWESSWPTIGEGIANVSSTMDEQLMDAASAASKTYMMPMSNLQFKHYDSSQNWYRRGELNIAQRMSQVLSVKPTFVQFQTWNDGGESSYIANVWEYAITDSPISGYIDGFDHSGWQNLLTPFISAVKAGASDVSEVVPLNGAKATGAFWYRSILTSATCTSDPLGKPNGWSNAEDVVNVAVLLASEAAGAHINVFSGGEYIGQMIGVKGLNAQNFPGLKAGTVRVEVLTGYAGETLLDGSGSKEVTDDAVLCNFNYQVVGL